MSDKHLLRKTYFRNEKWSINEMVDIMYDIAERSTQYYFSKYGKKNFLKD
ncbi:MAG: hypothetical protein PHS46_05625 [Candidatus Omnitrophica bacterium]|nr:hypothetical protein [Candidatus Omnitrophota bacterium]